MRGSCRLLSAETDFIDRFFRLSNKIRLESQLKFEVHPHFRMLLDLAYGETPEFGNTRFEDLARMAHHHRLLPKLAAHFPDDLGARQTLLRYGAKNLAMRREMELIRQNLVDHSIPFYFFKGLALADRIGESVPRHCKDVDVIVPAEHFCRAREVLDTLGYKLSGRGHSRKAIDHPWNLYKDETYVKESTSSESGQPAIVELHWRIFRRSLHINIERRLWRQIETKKFPDPETELSLLILHGLQHRFSRLRWYADVAGYVQNVDFNGSTLCEVFDDTNAVTQLQEFLSYANQLDQVSHVSHLMRDRLQEVGVRFQPRNKRKVSRSLQEINEVFENFERAKDYTIDRWIHERFGLCTSKISMVHQFAALVLNKTQQFRGTIGSK